MNPRRNYVIRTEEYFPAASLCGLVNKIKELELSLSI